MRAIAIVVLLLLAACAAPPQQDWGHATRWDRGYGYGYPHTGYQRHHPRRPVPPTNRPYWGQWGY
jgi:hypothetical protein